MIASIEDFMQKGLEKEYSMWEELANEHIAEYVAQRAAQHAAAPIIEEVEEVLPPLSAEEISYVVIFFVRPVSQLSI